MYRVSELSDTKRRLLAKYLRGDRQDTPAATVSRLVADQPAALAPVQERMWRHSQQHHEITCYNEPITIHRHGPLDVSLLELSFTELVRRHEAWRTTFKVRGGEALQIVHPPAAVALPVSDLRDVPSPERETAAIELASEEARIPFDLECGPLFRPRAVQLADDEYRIFITAHHLILDGVTVFNILYPEVTSIYDAFAAGKPSPLPELPVQYSDFARWQRRQTGVDLVAREAVYWREQLAGVQEPLLLPTDFPRPQKPTFRGSIRQFALPRRISDDLRSFSQKQRVTLFVILEAAFVILLNRYTGQEDITTGTVAPGGRTRSEFQPVMGLLQDRLPLRFHLEGNPTVSEILTRTRNVVVEALCHDDVPFDRIIDELQPGDEPVPSPFCTTMFSLEPPVPDMGPAWEFSTMDFDPCGARLDLYIEIDDRPAGMLGRVQYNRDVFKATTIDRLACHFETTLRTLAADPQQRLSDLPRFDLSPSSDVPRH